MKKIIFSFSGLLLYSLSATGQSSYLPSSLNSRRVEDFLDQSGILAFLSSSEFRIAMTVVITLSVAFWLYYIWASFQMAGQRTDRQPRQRTLTPDRSESFTRMPQLNIRMSAPALAAAGHQAPEQQDEEEQDSLHGRGD